MEHERVLAVRLSGLAGVIAGIGWLVSLLLIGVAIGFRVNEPAELIERVADNRPLFVTGNVIAIAVQLALVVFAVALVPTVNERMRPWVLSGGGLMVLAAALWAASAGVHMVYANVSVPRFREVVGPLRPAVLEDSDVVHQIADVLFFSATAAAAVALLAYLPVLRLRNYARRHMFVALAIAALFTAQFLWFVLPAFGVAGALGQALFAVWLTDVGMRTTRAPWDGVDPIS